MGRCRSSQSAVCFAVILVVCLQVAAHAQHHLAVRKSLSESGRVVTEFVPLTALTDREHEVAAMLGLGLNEAQSLMQAAQQTQA